MFLVSYEFLAFLLALLVLYYLIPGRFQWILLLAAGCIFYAQGGVFYLIYPMVTTMTTWFLAMGIGKMTDRNRVWVRENNPGREEKKEHNRQVKRRQRRLMTLGLLLNFGILAVLKYFHFFLDNVNALLGFMGAEGEFVCGNWILPLGISYYTFQSMGYLMDVYYRKYDPERNPARFALFVSFFPQLVAGPISRYDQMRDQLYTSRRFSARSVRYGAVRMLWGYFKKLVIADRLGPAVVMIISSPEIYDGVYVLWGMIGYTVWMYADFAGGMDIVLGAAQMFGIRLPENFERPFFSKSLGQFWRRWHMSLMLWLREYIFYPASTSRFSAKTAKLAAKFLGRKAGGKIPVYIATMTVWLTAGIWHGASWNFVVWGLANGTVLLISQELTGWYRKFGEFCPFSRTRWYEVFQILRTCILFAWLEMFEYYPFRTVFAMSKSLFTSLGTPRTGDGRFEALGLMGADLGILAAGIVFMAAVSALQRRESVRDRLERRPVLVQYGVVFGLFLLVLVTGVYGHGYDVSQFIYNQF